MGSMWLALLVVVGVVTATPPSPSAELNTFKNFHAHMDDTVYDTTAAAILADADQSTHDFVAMLETSSDDSLNMLHLATAFLELPSPISVEGDFDDGGPEMVSYHRKASAKKGVKEQASTALIAQDAAVLGEPNEEGTSHTSGISTSFTDSTTNLATLTESVSDAMNRLDQLSSFIHRRLKCRVDPVSCASPTPFRPTEQQPNCTRKYKYMCRSAYELTPGASQGATGGAADVMDGVALVQSQQAKTPSRASVPSPTLLEHSHHSSGSDWEHTLKAMIAKQKKLIDEQANKLAQTQDKLAHLQSAPSHILVQGSTMDTGATQLWGHGLKAAEKKYHPSSSAGHSDNSQLPVETSADQSVSDSVSDDSQDGSAKLDSESSKSDATDSTSAETNSVATPSDSNLVTETAETAETAEAAEAAEATTQVSTDHVAEESTTGSTETVTADTAADVVGTVEPTADSEVIQASTPQTPTHKKQPTVAEQLVAKNKAKVAAAAKIKHHTAAKSTHELAAKWASKMSGWNKADRARSHVYVPPSYSHQLNVLTELDEGLGSGVESGLQMTMPDPQLIHSLAAATYESSHGDASAVYAKRGMESLLQVGDGLGDDDVVPDNRTCVQRDEHGVCELFDDGSRCLGIDDQSALCGYVQSSDSNGDPVRSFEKVSLEELLM